jgi:anthranilate phosphoribosyltransferase
VAALAAALRQLVEGRDLAPSELEAAFTELLTGDVSECLVAAWLTAWRCRGETPACLAAARSALMSASIPWPAQDVAVLDTCGTGGDGQSTFNVSTAAALVVAAAGVPVVKHGNRGFTSPSGSADVLEALGLPIALDPAATLRCLRETGFAFCLASRWHPSVGRVASLRRQLGFRTLFNLVGPLANPARPRWQLVGVGRPEQLDLLAECLRLMDQTALVVHGGDGLDEISLTRPTQVRRVAGGAVTAEVWQAADFGLEPVSVAQVRAESIAASVQLVEQACRHVSSPPARLVLANAAAALHLSGRAESLKAGVALGQDLIGDGSVWRLVERLRAFSR